VGRNKLTEPDTARVQCRVAARTRNIHLQGTDADERNVQRLPAQSCVRITTSSLWRHERQQRKNERAYIIQSRLVQVDLKRA
jgi:hypothetical protein